MGTTRMIDVGDARLHVVEEGIGHPVVLIHGLAGDAGAWRPQMDALASRYRTVAFDNRGAGRSTQRDEPITLEGMAQDTLVLLESLEIEQAHIVGRSMGGAIAQHLALMAPERITSLVLCASFAKLDPLGHRVLTNMREVLEWRGNWHDHARHSIANFLSADYLNHHPAEVEQILDLIGGESRLPACYVAQNHACLMNDTLDQLPQITAPALVLSGDLDPICSSTATQWLDAGLPNSTSHVFAGTSHFFMREQPREFLEVLLDWLNRQTHDPAAQGGPNRREVSDVD